MAHPSNVPEARGQRSNESGFMQDLLAKGVPYAEAQRQDEARDKNERKPVAPAPVPAKPAPKEKKSAAETEEDKLSNEFGGAGTGSGRLSDEHIGKKHV